MSARLIALECDAQDPKRLAEFWAPMLGRTIDSTGTTLPGLVATDFALRLTPTREPKTELHRMHFDLTSETEADQQRSVDLAVRLGGAHLDVGQRGDEGHVVLADPEGNEFCVIEAGNNFLANTARIGALAGDGLAAVGYFWGTALGWPLVWDQDEETAIQSPRGGTKITWGGPPVAAKSGRNRLRWVLASDDVEEETRRLVELGAHVLGTSADRVDLADPEGNEFHLEALVE